MIYIDSKRCNGCGLCVEACPSDALRLIDGLAHIEQNLCQGCEACVEACPQGAIVAVKEQPEVPVPAKPVAMPTPAPVRTTASRWSLAGAALALVGQEIVPRVVSALLDAWDRRQSQAIASPSKGGVAGTRRMGAQAKGAPHRHRWRNKNQ